VRSGAAPPSAMSMVSKLSMAPWITVTEVVVSIV
jgi:hypothetical protein